MIRCLKWVRTAPRTAIKSSKFLRTLYLHDNYTEAAVFGLTHQCQGGLLSRKEKMVGDTGPDPD